MSQFVLHDPRRWQVSNHCYIRYFCCIKKLDKSLHQCCMLYEAGLDYRTQGQFRSLASYWLYTNSYLVLYIIALNKQIISHYRFGSRYMSHHRDGLSCYRCQAKHCSRSKCTLMISLVEVWQHNKYSILQKKWHLKEKKAFASKQD